MENETFSSTFAYNIIDETEAARFTFFSVVQTSSPIDSDICFVEIQLHCSCNRPSSTCFAEVIQPVKDRAIIADIESLDLFRMVRHVLRCDHLQKFDVVISMKFCEFLFCCCRRPVDIHFFIDMVVEKQIVTHSDSMRLIRMTRAKIVVPNLGCRRRKRIKTTPRMWLPIRNTQRGWPNEIERNRIKHTPS